MKTFYHDHLLKFTGCKPVKLSFPIDWYQDPYSNRSWRWFLHTFKYFEYLINEYNATANDGILDFTRGIIDSWIKEFSGKRAICTLKIVWQDHATALRAIWMCRFLHVCPTIYKDKYSDFFTALNTTLWEHASLLLKPQFYSANSNHGMDQAYSLYVLGKILDSGQSVRVAEERLAAEFDYAFTSEGVHRENSYSYHYGSLLRFAKVHDEFPDILNKDKYEKIIAGALAWMAYALRPDGCYPIMGDSMGHQLIAQFPPSIVNMTAYGLLEYALSRGMSGSKPEQIHKVFLESGYAVFRSCWPTSNSWLDAWHIIIKMGSLGRFHYHDDEGNIVLYAYGEDWLIDSGALNYVENDPLRKFVRSRAAHNVAVIKEEPRGNGDYLTLKSWQVKSWSENDAVPYVDFEIFLNDQTLLKRQVEFDTANLKLNINDKIFRDVDQPAGAYLYFHFPKDRQLIIDGSHLMVKSKKHTMHMDFESPQFAALFVRQQQEDGLPGGITSKIMFSHEVSKCVICELAGAAIMQANTSIWFE